jgi:hypothetical protein
MIYSRSAYRSLAVLALIVPILSGCIPDSRHPLPLPAENKGDDRLVGRWIFVGESEKGYVDISPTGGGRYHVLIQNGLEAGSNKTETDILATRIGGLWFVTVTGFGPPEEGEPEGAPHLIARYDMTVQGDWLVYPMRLETLAEDVRVGLVAGNVSPSDLWGEAVRLTADSEALAAYIASADPARIFADKPFHMRRP